MNYEYLMTTAARKAAADKKDGLKWAVGYTIPADTQDDHTEKLHIFAIFENPVNAEMLIDTMQDKSRFFITRM